jgi:hypothetical protein
MEGLDVGEADMVGEAGEAGEAGKANVPGRIELTSCHTIRRFEIRLRGIVTVQLLRC